MSSIAGPLRAPAAARARPAAVVVPRAGSGIALALGVALLLVLAAFVADGGLRLEPTTTVEVGFMLSGAACCAAALLHPRARALPPAGAAALAGFALLAAYTAVSVVWSIAPSDSWIEASRTLSYLSLFAGAMALVRLAPRRWPALLHGIALACVVVCAWALLTKVFPGALAETERYARLRAPFGYWNAVGLMAALGVPPLLWLGARRSGHAAANALAWPGIALLVVCLMLSYSRGALLALAVGPAVLVRRRAAAAARRGRAHGRARGRGAGHRLGVRAHRPEHGRPADRGARGRRPRARRAAAA